MPSREALVAIVGEANVLEPPAAAMREVRWGTGESCRCRLLVTPTDTQQVAAIVLACNASGQKIVVHGGRTGMAGATVSRDNDLVLSLEKLNRIEALDPVGRTMLAGAGATIHEVQEAARAKGSLFAVDFGARGSAMLGGAIATNAGGHRVFRYGMMRDHILGIEVVLADGTIVDSLKEIIKDNSGYDLKQLFVGSEGTLGIVTRAVLRLRPITTSRNTALLAFDSFEQVIVFFRWIEARLAGTLSAFEVMWRPFFKAMTAHRGAVTGIDTEATLYVLAEAEGSDSERDGPAFLEVLEDAFEQGLVASGVIAKSEAERNALWAIREDVDVLMRLGDRLDFDVSVPLRTMPTYLEKVEGELQAAINECSLFIFGHVADNNLHLMTVRAGSFTPEERQRIKDIIYLPLGAIGGSISAEHGIGLDKKASLSLTRNPSELALMQRLKFCLDPQNLLNPGRILDMD
ncbi:FAD/FMN-containing dehydrogenase [Novosphingobium chloroacetimidivorans]|uniref:FAD/FMN-containing dehydrogenase n=1 Tax=Novosphingobium chloroacetimidivorans TaxID=1428314 RepID=A0A7W7KD22_9SPHN|nr:FAD-binding oxidoreductase [Novosphingobium chloroacetimidivorans]MBB4860280.1 FAD/FMN-containing dehydrogenase [Novosphingobium chloroacetimidivorans]